jgi:DNA-binding PadR family transcriptional regulator
MLGYLSWKPLTGYDLKKIFAESTTLHWSGNSNQIYRALIELHNEGLVTLEVEYQESHPPRKIYSITDKGRAELRQWVMSTPEAPQIRNTFLVQLAWADQLNADELNTLLDKYQAELSVQLAMAREEQQRSKDTPQRTPRETYLWQMIAESRISSYETEINWLQTLRQNLKTLHEESRQS